MLSIELGSFKNKSQTTFVFLLGVILNTTIMGWESKRALLFSGWWKTNNTWLWGNSHSHRNRGIHRNVYTFKRIFSIITQLTFFLPHTVFATGSCFFSISHTMSSFFSRLWASAALIIRLNYNFISLHYLSPLSRHECLMCLFAPYLSGWSLFIRWKEWPMERQQEQVSSSNSSRDRATWISAPRFSSTNSSLVSLVNNEHTC